MDTRPASAHEPRPGGVKGTAAIAIAVAAFFFHPAARAQCGANRSTCSSCHDEVHATMSRSAAWHAEHAFADLCVACHGGNGEDLAPEVAHRELGAPLAGDAERCRSCHSSGVDARIARYRLAAAESPAPASPTTTAPGHTPLAPQTSPTHVRDLVAGLVACAGALGLAIAVWRREPLARDVVTRMRSPTWSPYLAHVRDPHDA